MALVPFNPPPGLFSDDTTFSGEGRWADGNNVRFWKGKPQNVGGDTVWSNNALAHDCLTLFAFSDSQIVAGTTSRLYDVTTSAATVILIGPGTNEGWSMARWGAYLLAVSKGGPLYVWTGSGSATEVTQSPNAITAMLVTAQRQVLAFGCNEESSGTFNGRCIRGCDLEDYTDWTTTSTNNAFEHIIDSQTEIVGAALVGHYVAVWTSTELFLGQFLGDPGQTYRFDRVGSNCGLLGFQCSAVVNGTVFWVTPALEFMRWMPGGAPELLPCPIQYGIKTTFTGDNPPYCYYNSMFDEIWFCFTNALNTYNYVAFSLVDGSWFKGDINRTAMMDSVGIITALGGTGRPATSVFSFKSSDKKIYKQEYYDSYLTWHIQSADQYVDQSQRRMMIRGIIPDFENQDAGATGVSLTLFCRNHPQSSAVTKGPYVLLSSTTKKDFRASGKIIAVKFSSTNANARLGKPLFDVVPMGER